MTETEAQMILQLMEDCLDGGVDAESTKSLAGLLREDAEAREFYVRQCQLHSMLAWEHGVVPDFSFDESPSPAMVPATTNARPKPFSTMVLLAALAVAATLIAALGLNLWQTKEHEFVQQRPSPRDASTLQIESESARKLDDLGIRLSTWKQKAPVATIDRLVGAKLRVIDVLERSNDQTNEDQTASQNSGGANHAIELNLSDAIRPGRYELSDGLVSLQFESGVDVLVEAPARFDVFNAMLMVLHQGTVSAVVPPQGKGFSVDTPSAKVSDFGTEFAVNVDQNSTSEIHVFDGKVDVQPRRAPPNTQTVRLTTDQATRVDSRGVIPQGIDIDHERFLRTLPDPEAADIAAANFITELNPVVHLRMGVVDDAKSLRGVGSQQVTGEILKGSMETSCFCPGKIGGAIHFGGPHHRSYARIDQYPKATHDQLTVAAWVRAESRPRWAAIAKHWAVELIDDGPGNSGLGGQFHFGLYDDGGDLEVQVRDRDGKIVSLRENVMLPLHQWHHVAFVADGKTVTLYRNGRAVASEVCDGVRVDGPDSLGIAAKLAMNGDQPDQSNPGFWHGRIDELVILHQALPAETIAILADH